MRFMRPLETQVPLLVHRRAYRMNVHGQLADGVGPIAKAGDAAGFALTRITQPQEVKTAAMTVTPIDAELFLALGDFGDLVLLRSRIHRHALERPTIRGCYTEETFQMPMTGTERDA